MTEQTRLYKILSPTDWQTSQALGYTKTALDDADGYVHLSNRAQVEETLHLHYAGVAEVQLLEFLGESLEGRLVWEESRGGQQFPHLYDTLYLRQTHRQWTLEQDSEGYPCLPKTIDL